MEIKRGKPLVPVMSKPIIAYEEPENLPELYNEIPGDVIEKILGFITLNLTLKEACQMVGISAVYFATLVRANIEGLEDKVNKAKLNQKAKHLKNIFDLNKNWKMSAWYLERTDKATYGKEITINGTNVGDEQVLEIGGKKIKF